MNQDRTERTCVTCPGLGRDGEGDRPEPNYYDYRYACEECRPQLRGILKRIPTHFAELDLKPRGGHHEHVSGSMDIPLGVNITVLGELYRGPSLTLTALPVGPDQEGTLPAVRILWYIASAWLPHWQSAHPDATLPRPVVAYLTEWLDLRLDWACNTLGGLIGDHAAYLHALERRLDRLVDPRTDRPQPIDGVVCRCDRYTLARHAGQIICTAPNCNVRMDDAEYERWTKLNAAAARAA